MAGTLTFIITHIEPAIPPKFFDHALALGDYGVDLPTHASRLDPFWHLARPVAYSAAGSYALPRALAGLEADPDLVGIVLQRKIISHLMIGRAAATAPEVREVTRVELQYLDVSATRPALGHDFFVCRPLTFGQGMIAHYALVHHAIDLFDYISLGGEMGILTHEDIGAIAMQRQVIAGGCEFGFYPASWLLPTLDKLSELGRAFLKKYERRIVNYDNYQIRALSFLSERLGSYLLLKRLAEIYGPQVDDAVFGHMCAVVEQGEYARGLAD